MAEDLLLEIGSEELPAGFIGPALASLTESIKKGLLSARLGHGQVRAFSTPRRLVVIVTSVEARQEDAIVEQRGPNKKAAFDSDGNPTKALLGFARAQGVKPEDLKTVTTDKGEHMVAVKELKGEKTERLLPEILTAAAASLNFPKAMRWGDHDMVFARPVHWLLALYGKKPITVSLGHLKSGTVTRGHRFAKGKGQKQKSLKGDKAAIKPGIKIDTPGAYIEVLRKAHVIADPVERRAIIEEALDREAAGTGGALLPDPDLLEEVTNLVEYPLVLMGSFDEEFLDLPRQVVIGAMREHQRYFSVVNKNGKDGKNGEAGELLPHFLTVANTPAKDPSVVVRGNERVLRARLSDAKFYFERDCKTPLAKWVEELKGVTFHAKLGTSHEKVERFTALALFIGEKLKFSDAMGYQDRLEDLLTDDPKNYPEGTPQYNRRVLGRAAMLSKADLVSGMVGEFPKLQGVMGKEYATRAGEAGEVAVAISEHYKPVSAGGELPGTDPGAIISISDKTDTIAGCFSVGLIPTGAADPYALRRSALGVISIILERGYVLELDEIVGKALSLLADKPTRDLNEVKTDVLEFFKERLRNQLLKKGHPFDVVDAVLSSKWFNLADAVKRIEALEKFKEHPDCESLTVAFKRVSNILKGQELASSIPNVDLLTDPHEKALFEASALINPDIQASWNKGDYEAVFETLAAFKDTIDKFFDEVMVMVDDEGVRNNRLILLNSVRDLYLPIADLSKLAV